MAYAIHALKRQNDWKCLYWQPYSQRAPSPNLTTIDIHRLFTTYIASFSKGWWDVDPKSQHDSPNMSTPAKLPRKLFLASDVRSNTNILLERRTALEHSLDICCVWKWTKLNHNSTQKTTWVGFFFVPIVLSVDIIYFHILNIPISLLHQWSRDKKHPCFRFTWLCLQSLRQSPFGTNVGRISPSKPIQVGFCRFHFHQAPSSTVSLVSESQLFWPKNLFQWKKHQSKKRLLTLLYTTYIHLQITTKPGSYFPFPSKTHQPQDHLQKACRLIRPRRRATSSGITCWRQVA